MEDRKKDGSPVRIINGVIRCDLDRKWKREAYFGLTKDAFAEQTFCTAVDELLQNFIFKAEHPHTDRQMCCFTGKKAEWLRPLFGYYEYHDGEGLPTGCMSCHDPLLWREHSFRYALNALDSATVTVVLSIRPVIEKVKSIERGASISKEMVSISGWLSLHVALEGFDKDSKRNAHNATRTPLVHAWLDYLGLDHGLAQQVCKELMKKVIVDQDTVIATIKSSVLSSKVSEDVTVEPGVSMSKEMVSTVPNTPKPIAVGAREEEGNATASSWADITFLSVGEDRTFLRYRIKGHERSKTLYPKELGLSCRRFKPGQIPPWQLLVLTIEGCGKVGGLGDEAAPGRIRASYKTNKSRLCKALCKFFGILSSPFSALVKEPAYRSRFKVPQSP